jgi:hypothetical protein
MTPTPRDDIPPQAGDGLRPSSRATRYGVAAAVVIAGILCGAIIPGTTGGTICTAVVGVGLVGVVSLVFYDVGLTEDRDRARRRERDDRLRLPDNPQDGGPPGPRGEPVSHRGGPPPHPAAPRRIDKPSRPRSSRIRDEHGRLS